MSKILAVTMIFATLVVTGYGDDKKDSSNLSKANVQNISESKPAQADQKEPVYEGKTLSEWITDLVTGDPKARYSAVTVLGRSGDKKVVPHLVEALKDESPHVRRSVVFALAGKRDKAVISGSAKERNIKPRHDNSKRIGPFFTEIGTEMDHFFSLHGFFPKNMPAGILSDEPRDLYNKKYILDENNKRRREKTLGVQEKIQNAVVNTFLVLAVDSFGKKHYLLPGVAYEAMQNNKEEDLVTLLKPYKTSKTLSNKGRKNVRIFIKSNLTENFTDGIPLQINCIKDIVNCNIVEYANFLELRYKKTKNNYLKKWSLWALIKLGRKNILPLLLENVKKEKEVTIKLLTICGIAEFGGKILPEYKEYVGKSLAKGDGEEKVFSVEALAAFGAESYDTLTETLKNPNPDVRTASMMALAKIAPKKAAIPLLESLKTENDIDLRYNAWYFLTKCLNPSRNVISLKSFHDNENAIIKELSLKVKHILMEDAKNEKAKKE